MPSRLLPLFLAFAITAAAQTYTPKTIRFEGAPSQDSAQLLELTGWKTGVPITKDEIQAGLQKLAETGSFTDINWHVDNAALVIKLTSASSESSALPVRFTNFAWWTPAELEQKLEARVPGYHGELGQTGTLLTQVEAALIALVKEKGATVTVSSIAGGDPSQRSHKVLALSIDHPSILVGNITLPEVKPAFGPTIAEFQHGLLIQDFDLAMTTSTIQQDAHAIFANAGYLDATVDPPVFSAPRAIPNGYAIDATATTHLGDIYHIAAVNFPALPEPLSAADLNKVIEVKAGHPASPMALDISVKEAGLAYQNLGYRDADATPSTSLDNIAHTATYALTIDRGAIYHIASVDLSLAPALQQSLAHNAVLSPGAVATRQVEGIITLALRDQNLNHTLRIDTHLNHADHTVTIQLVPAGHHPPA
ncbi:MAG: hypothetical protein V4555_15500 [Acidobacteriota bacterium]